MDRSSSRPRWCAAVVVLFAMGANAPAPRPPELPYTTACGPIALFVALESLGLPATLDLIINECRWKDSRPTTLETMVRVLKNHPGLEVRAARLSPEQLREFVRRGGVAIIPVRKSSPRVDHAVCVVEAAGDDLVYVDYPELKRAVSPAYLATMWDGQAILASRTEVARLQSELPWLILPSIALVVGAADLARGFGCVREKVPGEGRGR